MKYLIVITSLISLNACANSEDCQSLTTQSEMTICENKKLNKLEKELKEKFIYISKLSPDDKNLASAQILWEKYREKHCASVTNIYSGGSIYNYSFTLCNIRKTSARIKTLEIDYRDTINIITKGSP
ncbi:hypothetical protein MNBD_GAMMA23-2382 [hydrothermal vent metagenome]|uniref:Lysozyme inhibitor LprI-like N-terminal domain-containing protein n=1 Tax=hydrothermal vent metagenome TaxID=652676 RepID=A0A3B1AFL7_9ZZZZ